MIAAGHELQDLLSELLAEPRERTVERAATAYDRFAGPFPDQVVIFAAGQLGRFVLPGVRAAGLEPLAFCDNNPRSWGNPVDGVDILSPQAAVERYGGRACFLMAVYNASGAVRQLRELGARAIVPYPAFFWKYGQCLAEERLDLPHRILEQAGPIGRAFELLSDDRSRLEFYTQIRWRCLLDYGCLPKPDAPADMYFPQDLLALSPDEVFVDCGAFDGDSIRSFLEKAGGRFRHIYALEPDAQNIRALESYTAALPAEMAQSITVLPYAVGRENGIVRFAAEGTVGSKVVDDGGTVELPCRTLDSLFAAPEAACPTMIKMDIEGAEIQAIPGAADTIARCRPVMAVCAYHHCSDLWVLPELLKAALPDYRIFLRRYAEECWETVYYAIPPEHRKGGSSS